MARNKKTFHKAPRSSSKSSRRGFLETTATAAGSIGAACMTWPFLSSMGPAADTEALSTVDVDIGNIQAGQSITVMWRGKPVFIKHRTPEEIITSQQTSPSDLIDPQSDHDRFPLDPKWLVVVGVCTHLGCVPQGQKNNEPKGDFGGWFCPCHGSQYDMSGRVRKGPAPKNLSVPEFRFLDEKTIRIGEKSA